MTVVDSAGIISNLGSGEAFFNGSGSRSLAMLTSLVEKHYRELDYEKVVFIDNYDLYANFIMNGLPGMPKSFYVIETQSVQKNVSSSRNAVFERTICDIGFKTTEKIKLPLDLSDIISAYKKFYAVLQIPFIFSLSKNGNPQVAALLEAFSGILSSQGLSYEDHFVSEMDEIVELKVILEMGTERIKAGFIILAADRIMFSITGGLEKILKKVFMHSCGKVPLALNPFQLVMVTDKADRSSRIYSEIEMLEARGRSVEWVELGRRPSEAEIGDIAQSYTSRGAANILVIPDFSDSSKTYLYRGSNQRIGGMDFFQVLTIYLQKDFRGLV